MNWLYQRIEAIGEHLYSQFPGFKVTFLEAYLYSIALIFALFGLYSLGKFMLGVRRIKTVDHFFFWAECLSCGWKGEASRILKRCPFCYSIRLREIEEKAAKRQKRSSEKHSTSRE